MLYLACKSLIERGKTTGLADKLGVLYLAGLLTQEQLTELTEMMV